MYAFAARTGGYKAGVILLFVSYAIFIVGFGAPYWGLREYSVDVAGAVKTYYHNGLFMTCTSEDGRNAECSLSGISGHGAWFHALRTLECLCLIGLFIACVNAIVVNCCRKWPGPVLRVLEVVAGFSGLLGFIGVIVYVGSVHALSFPSVTFTVSTFTFDWALYLTAIGSGLAVIAAIIVTICNVDHSDDVKNKSRVAVDLPYMNDPMEPSRNNQYWDAPYSQVYNDTRDKFLSHDYPTKRGGYSSGPWSGRPFGRRNDSSEPLSDTGAASEPARVGYSSSPWYADRVAGRDGRDPFGPSVMPARRNVNPHLPQLFGYERAYSAAYEHKHYGSPVNGYGNPAGQW